MQTVVAKPCPNPGTGIRSGGSGRGLAIGDGKGPVGTPVGKKVDAGVCATPGEGIRSGGLGRGFARGGGRGPVGVPVNEKVAEDAYQFGFQDELEKLSQGCATPGMKIRSGGKGRGLARGNGAGPVGVPIENKDAKWKALAKNTK